MNRKVTVEEFKTESEKCALEIIKWMIKHEIWIDTCIYANGKRFSCNDGQHYHYENDFETSVYVEDNMDPRDYFDYVGDRFLCMSFEGPLYDILNYYDDFAGDYDERCQAELSKILAKYGKYYEMGNAWNFATYDK